MTVLMERTLLMPRTSVPMRGTIFSISVLPIEFIYSDTHSQPEAYRPTLGVQK